MEYKYVVLVALIVLSLMPATVFAQGDASTSEVQEEPQIAFAGDLGKLKPGFLTSINASDAVELAYTIRNLTYSLFEWEINYSVNSANVTLTLADKFLERAVNLSSKEPKKAVVYAFVAAVHYTHAPAYANPVLCKVVKPYLENDTVTPEAVNAAINVSSELRELLQSAINYTASIGYNTTLPEKLLEQGDNAIANATSLLEENTTVAFKYAVKGFKLYVRAYSVLVKAVFSQYTKSLFSEVLTSEFFECPEPPVKRVKDSLPAQIQERVKAKLESGEVKNMKDVVKEVNELAEQVRERLRLMEKENLREAMERVMETVKLRTREKLGRDLNVTVNVSNIVENYFKQGYRGTALAEKVLEEVKSKISKAGVEPELPLQRLGAHRNTGKPHGTPQSGD